MINKKGNEIVEATIVLPIIILTVLSMIMLLIYFFACLSTQMDVHGRLVDKALSSKVVMGVHKENGETGKDIGGVISVVMHRDFHSRCYLINEAAMIRLGEEIHGDTD